MYHWTKQLLVIFNHYTVESSDDGDVFTVDSYDAERFKLDIPEIQILGKFVRASDCLDFRPRVAPFSGTTSSPFDYDSRDFSAAGGSTTLIPKPNESAIVSYDYFLPRTDRLILTSEGQFQLVEGTPSNTNVQVPQILPIYWRVLVKLFRNHHMI